MKHEELSGRLRVAWLNEDETTTSFLDLLLRIYRGLADEFPLGVLPDGGDHGRAAALRLVQRQLLERLKDRTLLVLVHRVYIVLAELIDHESLAQDASRRVRGQSGTGHAPGGP
jgi:hypothetical protein